MADSLRAAALKADAALTSFLAEAKSAGKLWPNDIRTIEAALDVVRKGTR